MGRHVLLVEDEPHIVEAIRFILGRDGWQVTTHADGEGAAEAVRRARPDVLVLDVMLPNRSGFEILEELRADPATAALPVLMLSARSQARDRARGEALGATRYLTKPFANREVLASLNALAGA